MEREDLLDAAVKTGQGALSEYQSKRLLGRYGIPITGEILCKTVDEAVAAACRLGFPVVLKACSPALFHKSDRGAVELSLRREADVREAYAGISARVEVELEGILVQELVPGPRELMAGLVRDSQFGPCVMLGLGGVMADLLEDTVFRMAPLDMAEARAMAEELRCKKILAPFRGQAGADLESLARILTAVGRIGVERKEVAELDINPLIITPAGGLVAADALVVLKGSEGRAR